MRLKLRVSTARPYLQLLSCFSYCAGNESSRERVMRRCQVLSEGRRKMNEKVREGQRGREGGREKRDETKETTSGT